MDDLEQLAIQRERCYAGREYACMNDYEILHYTNVHGITEAQFYLAFPRMWVYYDYCDDYDCHGITWKVGL